MIKSYRNKSPASLHAVRLRKKKRSTPQKKGVKSRSRSRGTPRGVVRRGRRLRGGLLTNDCPICYLPLVEYDRASGNFCAKLSCNHYFHRDCLYQTRPLGTVDKPCPTCRRVFRWAEIVEEDKVPYTTAEIADEAGLEAAATAAALRDAPISARMTEVRVRDAAARDAAQRQDPVVQRQQLQQLQQLEQRRNPATERRQNPAGAGQREPAARQQLQQQRQQQQQRLQQRDQQVQQQQQQQAQERQQQLQLIRVAAANQNEILQQLRQRQYYAANEAAVMAVLNALNQQTRTNFEQHQRLVNELYGAKDQYNDAQVYQSADFMLVARRLHAVELAFRAVEAASTLFMKDQIYERRALDAARQSYPQSEALARYEETVHAIHAAYKQESDQHEAQLRERELTAEAQRLEMYNDI